MFLEIIHVELVCLICSSCCDEYIQKLSTKILLKSEKSLTTELYHKKLVSWPIFYDLKTDVRKC